MLIDRRISSKLRKRKHGQHLSIEEKLYLTKIALLYPEEHDSMRRYYKLSRSTFQRLKKDSKENFKLYESLEVIQFQQTLLDKSIKHALEKIVMPPQKPLTLWKIKENLKESTGIDLTKYKICRYLKRDLKYSYIKGNFRPTLVSTIKRRVAKGLFWVQYLKLLFSGGFITNWDESSFDRSVRRDFSWLPKGKGGSILNSTISNKSNLILSVFSNGGWICMIKDETTKSRDFWIFLAALWMIVRSKSENENLQLTVVLDNAKIHHSWLTTKLINILNLNIVYLPAYSPELAPVELWFKGVKSIIRSNPIIDKFDFSKEEGVASIMIGLMKLKKEYMQKCWIDSIKQAKLAICDAEKIAKEYANLDDTVN